VPRYYRERHRVANAKQNVVKRVAEHLEALGYFVDHGIVDLWRIGVPQSRRRHILLASKDRRLKIKAIAARHETPCVTCAGQSAISKTPCLTTCSTSLPTPRRTIAGASITCSTKNSTTSERAAPACHRDKEHSYNSIYGRLSWDKPAQTVTTAFTACRWGGTYTRRAAHSDGHEAARLQFFPDFFDFSTVKNRSSLARIIGNAVP